MGHSRTCRGTDMVSVVNGRNLKSFSGTALSLIIIFKNKKDKMDNFKLQLKENGGAQVNKM